MAAVPALACPPKESAPRLGEVIRHVSYGVRTLDIVSAGKTLWKVCLVYVIVWCWTYSFRGKKPLEAMLCVIVRYMRTLVIGSAGKPLWKLCFVYRYGIIDAANPSIRTQHASSPSATITQSEL